MSEHGPLGDHGKIDQEINVRWILLSGIILAAVTAVSIVVGLWVHDVFLSAEQARDVEPTPISATTPSRPVPMPRLQQTPARDLAAFRAREDEVLQRWRWVDEPAGLAQVPVTVALELVVENGLPVFGGEPENSQE